MATRSWKLIAQDMALQLEVGHDYCESHDAIEDGLAVSCPFCKDRKAVADFKAGVSTPKPDWKALAFMLFNRAQYLEPCGTHRTIREGMAASCPFCEGQNALRSFQLKSGARTVNQRIDEEGATIRVFDLLRMSDEEIEGLRQEGTLAPERSS